MTTKYRFIVLAAAMALGWADSGDAAPGGLPKCQADLKTCSAALGRAQKFPATGQTTVYTAGDDGDIRGGAPLNYTDNGDGTITDNNTKLMWEKQSDDGSIHDKDNLYTWEAAFAVHVATLNAENYAGYSDWRVPNVRELQSILNYQNRDPGVSAAFNTGCTLGATVLVGSCTALSGYWSSSTVAVNQAEAWNVGFGVPGDVLRGLKDLVSHVRAVRGGL